MITLDDCAAFCDADPDAVEQLAHDEHLALPLAFAMAQASAEKGPTLQASREPALSSARLMKFPLPEMRIAA